MASLLTRTALVGGPAARTRLIPDVPPREAVHKIRPRLSGAGRRSAIAFADNDRPGVMLFWCGGRWRVHGALGGRMAVLFANHDRVVTAVLRLLDAGVRIRAAVDSRASGARSLVAAGNACAAHVGCRGLAGYALAAAAGHRDVRGASIAPVAGGRRAPHRLQVHPDERRMDAGA
jgi:hypothetical protein